MGTINNLDHGRPQHHGAGARILAPARRPGGTAGTDQFTVYNQSNYLSFPSRVSEGTPGATVSILRDTFPAPSSI